MKGKYQIFSLLQKPDLKQEGARWFHEKWNIPEEAYLESMEESLREHGPAGDQHTIFADGPYFLL